MTLLKGIENVSVQNEPKFITMQKNLIQIGYFSVPDYNISEPKQEKLVKFTKVENENLTTQVEIIAPRRFGLPTTGDLTKYLAFQDLIQEKYIFYKKPITNPVSFTHYELLKHAGQQITKKNYVAVQNWLKRMKSTTVHYFAEEGKKFGNDLVSVFDRVISYGEKLDNGEIADCNYVWLSQWELDNLRQNQLIPIDFATYNLLKNQTAKILVPHLQIWLYASRNDHIFNKSYSEFCALLGIKEYECKSKIVEKLLPAMKELKEFNYIDKFEVSGSRHKGFKVSIWHGQKFFRDLKIFFVLNGNSEKSSQTLPTNKPKLLIAKPTLDEETQRIYDKLIAVEIETKSAEAIIQKLPTEEIEARLKYCQYLFLKNPEKYKSQRGYIFTILNNDDFSVPESVMREIEDEEQRIGEAVLKWREKEIEAKEQAKEFWLEDKYEEFLFQAARKVSPVTFEEFERNYLLAQDYFNQVIDAIQPNYNEQIIDSWFKPLQFIRFDQSNSTLHILASQIAKEWIEVYYQEALNKVFENFDVPNLKIVWITRNLLKEDINSEYLYRLYLLENYQATADQTLEQFYTKFQTELDEKFEQCYAAEQEDFC